MYKQKFHVEHFPAGTQFRAPIVGDMILTARCVTQNAPKNYLIIYEPIEGKESDFCALAIGHVTEVVKRGEGYATWRKEDVRAADKPSSYEATRNRYAHFGGLSFLISYLAAQVTKNTTNMVDTELLVRKIYEERLIRKDQRYGNWGVHSCSKKKLKKAIKRLIPHCLLNHEKEEREYQEAMNAAYHEMCNDMDWAWDQYDMNTACLEISADRDKLGQQEVNQPASEDQDPCQVFDEHDTHDWDRLLNS